MAFFRSRCPISMSHTFYRRTPFGKQLLSQPRSLVLYRRPPLLPPAVFAAFPMSLAPRCHFFFWGGVFFCHVLCELHLAGLPFSAQRSEPTANRPGVRPLPIQHSAHASQEPVAIGHWPWVGIGKRTVALPNQVLLGWAFVFVAGPSKACASPSPDHLRFRPIRREQSNKLHSLGRGGQQRNEPPIGIRRDTSEGWQKIFDFRLPSPPESPILCHHVDADGVCMNRSCCHAQEVGSLLPMSILH